ncbi:hypothetical protein MOKP106_42760 [Mycobacterium avium subsp. hominissuis]|uniref:hypothetical protein n=1 Tax=Mycobacterium avium TaxID=1764 RepID=UPI0018C8731B|nr:hypothetical protein [Mycobacterium avium]
MPTAVFINYTNHYLHPSSLELIDVFAPDELATFLHAPPPASRYVESFATTGIFGDLDFWFSPRPGPVPRDVNRPATALLLSAAYFRAKTVPLLRGRVIVMTHDADGALAGLTNEQIRAITVHANRWRGPLMLDWRCAADDRAQRRRRRAQHAAQERDFWDSFTARSRNRRALGNG